MQMRGIAWTRMVALTLALVLAAALAAGCGSGSSDGDGAGAGTTTAGRSGGQLVWGTSAEVQSLDGVAAGDGASWQVLDLVYDTLVAVGDDLKPVPALATSWKQTSPTSYEFEIRRGVKFSNGREMTVDDVVGSLRRIVDPKTAAAWAAQLGSVERIEQVGPWRVRITLREPRASFLAALAGDAAAAILPMRELRAGTFDPRRDLLGTGPFKLVSHKQDESWTLARNPFYWGPEPKVDRLLIRVIPEDAARVAALRDGSADVATFDTPDAVNLLKGQANVKTVVENTTDYYRLDVNAITSPFRDPRLRQALALAIDRSQISELALAGSGEPTAATAPGFPDSCDASAVPFATPDLDRARALVDAAGANGKTVTIMAPSSIPPAAQIAQVLQQNLKQIGLNAKIQQVDAGEWLKRLITDPSAPFDLSVAYLGGQADPGMVLAWWNPAVAQWNKNWLQADQKLIGLVNQSLSGTGGDRRAVLQQTCDRIAQDANIIPLVTRATFVGYRDDQVSVVMQQREPYTIALRHIAEFNLKR